MSRSPMSPADLKRDARLPRLVSLAGTQETGGAGAREPWRRSSSRHCATGCQGWVEIESEWKAGKRERTARAELAPGHARLPCACLFRFRVLVAVTDEI